MSSLDRRRTPARPDLAAEHLKGKVEATRFVVGRHAQVSAAFAPLRREGRNDAPLDTELLFGEQFTIYEEKNGWAWGQAQLDDYVGFVPLDAVQAELNMPSHTVSALRTLVFPAPDLKTPPLGFLSMNAKFHSLGEQAGYHETLFEGRPGYVSVQHVAPVGQVAGDFVAVALQFLGTPYLWGGKQSLGLDCSGLVQTACERAGIAAPRDASMQEAELGTPLAFAGNYNLLRRGDFVFWKGHVGIMTDKKNMLHANATAMAVSIDPAKEFAKRIERTEGPITSVRRL